MREYALSEGKKYKIKPYTLTTLIFFYQKDASIIHSSMNSIAIDLIFMLTSNILVSSIQFWTKCQKWQGQLKQLFSSHTHTHSRTHTQTRNQTEHCYDNKCRCQTRIASLSLEICKILIHVISKFFLKLLFKRLHDLYYTTKLILHLVFTI